MTEPSEHRAAFRAAVDQLIAATGRLSADLGPEAFLQWHQCVEELRRLHQPVAERALARSRRSWP